MTEQAITPGPRFTELQLRLLTAAVGIPLLAIVILVGGWPFAIVAGIIALLASAEWVHGWLLPSLPLRTAWTLGPMFSPAAIMVIGAHASWMFVAVGLGFAVALMLITLSPSTTFGPRKPYRVIAGCFVYIGALLSTLVLLRGHEAGRDWVFIAILSTFAVDTGAYTVGRLIGRHRLAPAISPKKTWEGAIGGYAAGIAALLALNALFDTGHGTAAVLPLALMVPVAAIIGDLVESWIKRRMGVKDASGLLPGHGGFLDRLDSVLFVAPVVYLYVALALD